MILHSFSIQSIDALPEAGNVDPTASHSPSQTATIMTDASCTTPSASGHSCILDYILLGIMLSILAFLWRQ
jgi:hypothetical protein